MSKVAVLVVAYENDSEMLSPSNIESAAVVKLGNPLAMTPEDMAHALGEVNYEVYRQSMAVVRNG